MPDLSEARPCRCADHGCELPHCKNETLLWKAPCSTTAFYGVGALELAARPGAQGGAVHAQGEDCRLTAENGGAHLEAFVEDGDKRLAMAIAEHLWCSGARTPTSALSVDAEPTDNLPA